MVEVTDMEKLYWLHYKWHFTDPDMFGWLSYREELFQVWFTISYFCLPLIDYFCPTYAGAFNPSLYCNLKAWIPITPVNAVYTKWPLCEIHFRDFSLAPGSASCRVLRLGEEVSLLLESSLHTGWAWEKTQCPSKHFAYLGLLWCLGLALCLEVHKSKSGKWLQRVVSLLLFLFPGPWLSVKFSVPVQKAQWGVRKAQEGMFVVQIRALASKVACATIII